MTQHLKKVGVVWPGHVPLGTTSHILLGSACLSLWLGSDEPHPTILYFLASCGSRTCVVSLRAITCSNAISTIRYAISSIYLFPREWYQLCTSSTPHTTHRDYYTETHHTPSPLSVVHSLVTIYTLGSHTRAGRLGHDSFLVSFLSVSTRIYCHPCSSLVLVVSHNMIPPVILEPRRPGELLIRKTPRRTRGLAHHRRSQYNTCLLSSNLSISPNWS
jgi:hypothetical protein